MAVKNRNRKFADYRFEFDPEGQEKADAAWLVLFNTYAGDEEDLSKFLRWAQQKVPVFTVRPDLEFHNPHTGYVYAIQDPRIVGKPNVIFIGSSPRPWEAMNKHMRYSGNLRMRAYVKEMFTEMRKIPGVTGFSWREKEVVDAYEDETELSPWPSDKIIEIPWFVLDYYDPYDARSGFTRDSWVETYLEKGHPLLNGRTGRPGNKLPWA